MKFSFEFLYWFEPTHDRKIETEMILAAFNNIFCGLKENVQRRNKYCFSDH